MLFKPMLAGGGKSVQRILDSLKFPLLGSTKLDGIRGFNSSGTMYSRNLLPFGNKSIQEAYSSYTDFDGEFITGEATDPKVFSHTSSVVMSHDKTLEDTKFWAFDWRGDNKMPYFRRLENLAKDERVHVVQQVLLTSIDDVLAMEKDALSKGFEGLILRNPDSPYKVGRSTLREGHLIKLKRFVDDEAVIVGFKERMHNDNEKTLFRNGEASRSSHQAGLVGLNTLGSFVCLWHGLELLVGTGFDNELAAEVWANRDKYLGRSIKFKYFPIGVKDLPRHPVFLGFRSANDMSE